MPLRTLSADVTSFANFIAIAAPLQLRMADVATLEFGLLTSDSVSLSMHTGTSPRKTGSAAAESELKKILAWSAVARFGGVSFWASHCEFPALRCTCGSTWRRLGMFSPTDL